MIPSLLQIPSAVSDSKLHSVLPNNGKGDFQFDRSTGATRINRDGLIEEVGYFSSELVQNGNFSELGSEALINGDFATDSDWTKGTGWVIMNGYAESDGTNAPLDQVSRLTIGKTYKVVITVTNMTSSALSVRLGTSSSNAVLSILENGTYTAYGVAGATTFRLRSQGFDGRIQNVSVKQVDPNDRWTLGTGWSLGDGVASSDGSQSSQSNLYQAGIVPINKTYKATFSIVVQAGSMVLAIGGSNAQPTVSSSGTYTFTSKATSGDSNFYFSASSDFIGTVDNVSVVEVQGDRPRLSYDITNGVVEDKPHLLLEPSATNLVTFSEDFSQSYWVKSGASVTSGFVSPDGTNNAYKLVEDSANSRHFINSTEFSTPDTVYSSSVFVKPNGRNKIALRENAQTGNYASFNLSNGTLIATNGVSASIELMFNGWYRINYQITSGATIILGFELLSDSYTSGDPYSNPYQGDGLSGIYIFGAQVESQSYATSYIPTAGTTITRAAETCNNSKPSVNSTEGVLYCEIKALANDLTYRAIYINDNDATRYIGLRFSNNSNQLQAICYDGANLGFVSTTLSDITNTHKIALQYQSSGISLYVNGGLVGSDATFTGIAANQLDEVLFDSNSGTQGFYGKCKGLAVYNEALSESQLMQLTGVTASSIYNNFVTRTASFTVEALNEVKKVIDNL